ncbi:hypothetical protein WP5W18E06_13660 [Klebsiella quasipneumoniae]|uniref:hypothetical protein n=1 Tax=Klebsiella quasipneumoniae TaxID=1463165 RepID=UPI0015DC3BDA|nr:hypothetical protein [Klebsiella quasipneumoniae]BBS20829.1 hypothetical protein WP5W18E06_13660 [Klebsiella quasipneumoniae]
MLRQSDIAAAFRESILRSSKGFQYLHTRVFERDGGYVVLDASLKPKQGSQVLIQHGGGTELATLRGKSLITEDGEAIEGEALDDVAVIGVVTFTICDVRQDNAVV